MATGLLKLRSTYCRLGHPRPATRRKQMQNSQWFCTGTPAGH
ncbi:hypothetical protein BRCON_1570 [Candidatus Sumerlaea chitinivorans]|uniref:Uncharacterized protein n=1 Tax=Sumerlaea chitinivorans TaxID=2250252 RepID=A0A2Z4Y562_SUMC1|nr:hypothetical protein BRCON_1570 [Candidatus Sumerlaea chitinivorans]